jgi:CheY-like chemotaxis protein
MTQRSVLVIEDDSELSEIFAEILQSAGFKTEIVADGRSALVKIRETSPDIIILDMHLPYVSGLDILNTIRADECLRKTKVLVVTADALLAKEVEDKADVVFLKPVTLGQLSDVVSRLAR